MGYGNVNRKELIKIEFKIRKAKTEGYYNIIDKSQEIGNTIVGMICNREIANEIKFYTKTHSELISLLYEINNLIERKEIKVEHQIAMSIDNLVEICTKHILSESMEQIGIENYN